MTPVFEAAHYTPGQYKETYKVADHENEADARAAVEQAGGGSLVKFSRQANLPGCLPAVVLRSLWMEVYANRQWRKINIHG